jgi:hypothetical protein
MKISALVLAAAASLLAVPAFAHHSFAIFDQTKVNYLTGTVKDFELTNPHAWLHVNIVDAKGQTSMWSFEGGWKRDDFPAGKKVVVGYRPMKDGSRGGQLMNATPDQGKKVCSNRGCGDGSGNVVPGQYRE